MGDLLVFGGLCAAMGFIWGFFTGRFMAREQHVKRGGDYDDDFC